MRFRVEATGEQREATYLNIGPGFGGLFIEDQSSSEPSLQQIGGP
jgi:hypothetical protein